MKYSIDTCSLVEPWRRAYPPDFLPNLWDADLPSLIGSGELRASQEVRIELEAQDDELLAWAKDQDDLFVEVDPSIEDAVKYVLAAYPTLVNAQTGRSGADPFVIALAQVNGCTVVTEEKFRPTKPRIPDVCGGLGIPCINTLQLILAEGWQYRS
jgi:hypothetical protein